MLTNFRPKTCLYPNWNKNGPRAAMRKSTTIDMLGINLHQQKDIHRSVNNDEVSEMKQKIEKHDEITNEVFNLMGAHIQKRCEERVNFYVITDDADSIEDIDEISILEVVKPKAHNTSAFNSPRKISALASDVASVEEMLISSS